MSILEEDYCRVYCLCIFDSRKTFVTNLMLLLYISTNCNLCGVLFVSSSYGKPTFGSSRRFVVSRNRFPWRINVFDSWRTNWQCYVSGITPRMRATAKLLCSKNIVTGDICYKRKTTRQYPCHRELFFSASLNETLLSQYDVINFTGSLGSTIIVCQFSADPVREYIPVSWSRYIRQRYKSLRS